VTRAPDRDRAASERTVLVGLDTRRRGTVGEDGLHELAALAAAAGATVVSTVTQQRERADPATLIGAGKVRQLAAVCDDVDAGLVVFDNELSPAQLRNLEHALDRKVLDRTQLILDIFARRARSREGKLQVELAQLQYLLPRLVGTTTWLSRLGGGIGTRGPGETKLETDRRRVRQRIGAISREIVRVRQRRGRLRDRRRQGPSPTAALVGYTNAGKTTLFNLLTRERAETADAVFATLDPVLRAARLPSGLAVLVSDTVGFIERLPHSLVAAFRATLEEVTEAELLIHVVDASSANRERHIAAVQEVLGEVQADQVPQLLVFNKCDRIGADEMAGLEARHPDALFISALRAEDRQRILERVATAAGLDARRVLIEIPRTDENAAARVARVYRHSRVLSHRQDADRVALEVEAPARLLPWLDPSRGRRPTAP